MKYIISFLIWTLYVYNLRNLTINEAVTIVYEIILLSFDIFIPKIKIYPIFTQNISWSNLTLRNLIKLKKLAYKNSKKQIHNPIILSFPSFVENVKIDHK